MANDAKSVDEMVDQFVSQLIVDAGMGKDLEEDALDELKKDLGERLENRVNAVMLAHIPESKLEEFEKLLDAGNPQATQAFCSENIPNLPELLAAEFSGFRKRYIS